MKKLLLIPILMLVGCSGDDDSNSETVQPEPNNYLTISFTNECHGNDTEHYCVTPEVGNQIEQDWINGENPCPTVTFTDVDGIERTGILNGVGRSSVGCQPME